MMHISSRSFWEALSSNRNLFAYFILLSLTWKISDASQSGIGSAKNKLNTSEKNGDWILIQSFPFNYSVPRYPHRQKPIKVTTPVRDLNNETRIVGGPETKPHEFPHMLAVYFYNRKLKKFEFGCGASILNKHWALTAANCVESERPETVKIVAGEHDRSKREGTEVLRNISTIYVHELYNGNFQNDVALLRFSTPLTFNDDISPIQMAVKGRQTTGNAIVSGWGLTSYPGQTSMVLRKAQVPIITKKECQKLRPKDKIIKGQICAGTKQGEPDACKGDSGGPLMQPARKGSNHILVGIVSYGTPCAHPNQPTVYTNVAKYRYWIDPKIIF